MHDGFGFVVSNITVCEGGKFAFKVEAKRTNPMVSEYASGNGGLATGTSGTPSQSPGSSKR